MVMDADHLRRLLAASAVMFFFSSCSPPPPLLPGDIPAAVSSVTGTDDAAEVRASGEMKLSAEGEEYRVKADVRKRGSGEFRADFYASFGMTVASVHAEGDSGKVVFGDESYIFSMTQGMDTLPFRWARCLTMGRLIDVLAGEVPRDFSFFCRRPPDSCNDDTKTISAVWETDSVDIRAVLRKKTRTMERLEFILKGGVPCCRVILQSFSSGRAHKIEMRENDRNYFYLKYARFR